MADPRTPPSHRPDREPIGLALARTGKQLERAFDAALAAAGGSRPTWLILLAVVSGAGASQVALAGRLGVTGPTLVHHLDRMEAAGLLRRTLDPGNRRVRALELTDAGRAAFHQLRAAATAFDARIRVGVDDADLDTVRAVLDTLRGNLTAPPDPPPKEDPL